MKTFIKFFAVPLLIGIIASVLYLIDAVLGNLFVNDGSFMWVGFSIWTIFYGAKISDRIRGFVGVIIGFISAIVMMLITKSFELNIYTISLSTLVGVFLINMAVMFLDNCERIWMNSVIGVFAGIFLTFSGLGVGLNPISDVKELFLMLGIISTYTILGLICGYLSTSITLKIKKSIDSSEGE